MRLLFAVCFLGSWLATISNSMAAKSSPLVSSTDQPTHDNVSSKARDPSKSGNPSEATASPTITSSLNMTTNTISDTTEIPPTVKANSSATPNVTGSTIRGSTTVTATALDTTSNVQPTSTMLSTTLQGISSTPTTFRTTLASSNPAVSEKEPTPTAKESETTHTTPGPSSQVTSESTPTVGTVNSTYLNSSSSNVAATGATTSGLQTSPTTLQTTSTETISRNETAVEEAEQDQTRGTQESTKTESTTRHPRSPANTPEPRIQSEVKCLAESKQQTTSLILKDYTNCKHFIQNKKEKLTNLLCNKLIEREDLKFLTYCEIKLSPDMKDSKKLNIDILFRVDERKISKLLIDEEKSLQELGLQLTSAQKGDIEDSQSATELKKLIAMVVTGSLLLLVFLSAIIYRCAQRKSQHKKDLCLNEEMHVVDNGCHDNPAMDIIESEPEMQEKANSKTSCQENMDGWIVPIDSLIKNEPEEEDTHL